MDNKVARIFVLVVLGIFIAMIPIVLVIMNHNYDKAKDNQYAIDTNTPYQVINTPLAYKWSAINYYSDNRQVKVYYIYDTYGQPYQVPETEFNNALIPQKISDNLYLMPDGSYVAGLIK